MTRAVILSAVRTPVGRYGGGLAGTRPDDLAALIYGGAVTAPAGTRMGRLGQEIQAGGKPPTPEQMAQIGALQAAMVQGARINVALLAIALIAMAIARYV